MQTHSTQSRHASPPFLTQLKAATSAPVCQPFLTLDSHEQCPHHADSRGKDGGIFLFPATPTTCVSAAAPTDLISRSRHRHPCQTKEQGSDLTDPWGLGPAASRAELRWIINMCILTCTEFLRDVSTCRDATNLQSAHHLQNKYAKLWFCVFVWGWIWVGVWVWSGIKREMFGKVWCLAGKLHFLMWPNLPDIPLQDQRVDHNTHLVQSYYYRLKKSGCGHTTSTYPAPTCSHTMSDSHPVPLWCLRMHYPSHM